jgi:hypothetical protein
MLGAKSKRCNRPMAIFDYLGTCFPDRTHNKPLKTLEQDP